VSATPSETDLSESTTSLDSLGPSSPSSTFSFGSQGPDTLSYLVTPSQQAVTHGSSFASSVSNVSDCSSSACSSRSSPRLELYDPSKFSNNSFHLNFDTLEIDPDLANFFSNPVDPYVEDNYSPCLQRVQTEADLSGWFETNRACTVYGNIEPPPYPQAHSSAANQDFVTGPANLNNSCSGKLPFSRQPFATIPPASQIVTASCYPPSLRVSPTTEELNHYCMSSLL